MDAREHTSDKILSLISNNVGLDYDWRWIFFCLTKNIVCVCSMMTLTHTSSFSHHYWSCELYRTNKKYFSRSREMGLRLYVSCVSLYFSKAGGTLCTVTCFKKRRRADCVWTLWNGNPFLLRQWDYFALPCWRRKRCRDFNQPNSLSAFVINSLLHRLSYFYNRCPYTCYTKSS